MDRKRRTVLGALAAFTLAGVGPAAFARTAPKPINLIGIGNGGEEFVSLLAERNPSFLESDYVGHAITEMKDKSVFELEPLGRIRTPRDGPLVLVAEAARVEVGRHAYPFACSWEVSRRTPVRVLLLHPFWIQGQRCKERAKRETARFAKNFGPVAVFDHQAIWEQLVLRDEIRLADLYRAVHSHVAGEVEYLISGWRAAT